MVDLAWPGQSCRAEQVCVWPRAERSVQVRTRDHVLCLVAWLRTMLFALEYSKHSETDSQADPPLQQVLWCGWDSCAHRICVSMHHVT